VNALAVYQFLTVEQLAEICKRNIIAVRRRCLSLYSANVLNRARRDKLAPYVYFLGEEGAKTAYERGYLPDPHFVKSKSSLLIPHDLEITNFHLALEKAAEITEWRQWRGDLKDTVDGETLIPDAYFALQGSSFFLEVVKSYESEYESGESNIERKLNLYNNYRNPFREKYGASDFRVLWVLPTQERVLRLLTKIEDRFPYRRFYFTHEELYRKNISGKIWWTPKDFRDATYSIDKNS